MGRRAIVIVVAVVASVGAAVAGGAAWSAGASTGAAAAPANTTEDPPTTTRTKVIVFDAEAQLHALVDLPDPLPPLEQDSECVTLTAHDGRWPVFNGSLITVPAYRARLCPEPNLGNWTVTWYGTSQNGETGDAYLSAFATFILEPDGTPGPRMLTNLTTGKHRYQYIPESDLDDDRYVLTDSFYGDLVATTLGAQTDPTVVPTAAATTLPSGTAGASPAVPVGGSPGYAG